MTRTSLLKVGGAHLDDPRFLDGLLQRAAVLAARGPVVLVHGGGRQIGELQSRLDLEFRKHQGLRVTSTEAMDVVAMILPGLLNKRLVAHFVHGGVQALGVSGADAGLLRAPFWGTGELGRVGAVPTVDESVLERLLSLTDVLVVAPVCLAPDGGLLNVNADTVAQALAIALGADVLEFVTDVDAIRGDDGPLPVLTPDRALHLIEQQIVTGGMRPKVEAAIAAVDAGVGRVRVGSLKSLGSGRLAPTEVRA